MQTGHNETVGTMRQSPHKGVANKLTNDLCKMKETISRIHKRCASTCTRVVLMLAIVFFAVQQTCYAKPMKALWLSMPDSLAAYLSKAAREEGINLLEMKLVPEMRNQFGNPSKIDTLTNEYISVTLSEKSSMQMRLLPTEGGDSIVCVAKTYSGPLKDSSVSLYTQDWGKLSDVSFGTDELLCKPDTMTSSRLEELKQMLDPCLVAASLQVGEDVIVATPSAANVTLTEEAELKAILKETRFKWDGKAFKREQ